MINVIPKAFVQMFFQISKATHEAAKNPATKQAIDAMLRGVIGGAFRKL